MTCSAELKSAGPGMLTRYAN